jgi:CheY-like chemotaxis protein
MPRVRVLIVEDIPLMRNLWHRCLKAMGLREIDFSEATNGLEALEVVRKMPVDLILLDLSMPVMDGLEFLRRRRLEALAPDALIAVISGYGTRGRVDEATALGARTFLVKPFTPAQMADRLLPLMNPAWLASAQR